MEKLPTTSQSNSVNFELHSLGWKAFQDLCSTIIGEVLGQTIEIFSPSRDGGRDGAFYGFWEPTQREAIAGPFTVQCKFTSKREKSLSLTGLGDELEKAQRLAGQGFATNYILMTNHQVSGAAYEKIHNSFLAIDGIEHFLLFGCEWITLKILESPRLRMLVPRVYGLGDLSQILDTRAYSQAQDILSAMGGELAKFVVTDVYQKSVKALLDHNFVLLLGEPASGKTTIAASLAIGAIDIWRCSTLKIRSPDEFVKHWNTGEHQFFWVDDAFGTTQYQRSLANGWNGVFPHMSAAIRKGARILFTSRDYIYRAAQEDLKINTFPVMGESQVVINVQELSKSEKEQILYNHIKLGNQPIEFRSHIKTYLPTIAESPSFLPEVARRLGDQFFTKSIVIEEECVIEFFEKPLQFLVDVLRSIDPKCRAAIALIFMYGGALESPISLTNEAKKALDRLGATLADVSSALTFINGSLVKYVQSGAQSKWTFKHPTIGDAFATIVAEDPELLDIYLAGTRPEKLIEEVVCGGVQLEGAKVIVPESRYDSLIHKIEKLQPEQIYTFLASRCNEIFLRRYLEYDTSIIKNISSPHSYLSALPQVSLLSRLHEFQLLPEEWRQNFVVTVTDLAIETPDADFLKYEYIRNMFKKEEISQILKTVWEKLLPNLSEIIESWESGYKGRFEDTDDWFDPLIDALEVFLNEFPDDNAVIDLIDEAKSEIDSSKEYLRDKYLEHYLDLDYEYDDDEIYSKPHIDINTSERSIFDDIDG